MKTQLKSLLAVAAGALVALVALRPAPAAAEADKKAERLWKSKCASCHGADGKGDTDQGKEMGIGDITAAAWQKEFTDEKIKDTVAKGLKREKNGKQQEMKPLADLKPEQVDAIIKYVRTLAAK
jgi:mono/diheme cytochrome c family protein